MSKAFYGLDFGTSNLSIAIQDGDTTRVLPIDGRQKTMPTVLYFGPNGGHPVIGQSAIFRYVQDDMSGRFMQSLKSVLPNSDFTGTYLDRLGFKDIEGLIAYILSEVREKANKVLGQDIDRAVIGRPAQFSKEAEREALAEKRLRKAAKLAGFNEVELQLEPIAAAFHYELSLEKEEVVLVADLGGGTTDFTIIRVSPDRRGRRDRSKDILATGGVYIGGDRFNSSIMAEKLLKYFGEGTKYKSWDKWMNVPAHILNAITEWQNMAFLKDNHTVRFLAEVARHADDKESAARLQALIMENLGFSLFQAIETAKCGLSEHKNDCIYFNQSVIRIIEHITRTEFEQIIGFALKEYDSCVDEVLEQAGLTSQQIDTVFMTGGSSLVPGIQRFFANKFGQANVRTGDTFISVASGLAASNLLAP